MIIIQWNTKELNKEWKFKTLNEMPIELINLIIEFTNKKVNWYAYQLNLTSECCKDLEADMIVMAMESISKYNKNKSSFHTFLDRIFTNNFKNIKMSGRPGLQNSYGIGRIEYNSDAEELTGEVNPKSGKEFIG